MITDQHSNGCCTEMVCLMGNMSVTTNSSNLFIITTKRYCSISKEYTMKIRHSNDNLVEESQMGNRGEICYYLSFEATAMDVSVWAGFTAISKHEGGGQGALYCLTSTSPYFLFSFFFLINVFISHHIFCPPTPHVRSKQYFHLVFEKY